MRSKFHHSLSATCVLAFGLTIVNAQNPQPNPTPQSQPQQPTDSSRPSAPSITSGSHDASASITVTGCVARDTMSAGSTGAGAPSAASQGQSGASQPGGMFKLTNIQMGGRAAAGGASADQSGVSNPRSGDTPSARSGDASGAAHQGAGASNMTANEYRLVPAANVDLSAHVGHRVQVVGTRSGVAPGSAGRATGMSSGSAQSPGSGSSANSGSGSASSKPGASQSGVSDSQRGGSMQDHAGVPTLMVTSVTMISATCQ